MASMTTDALPKSGTPQPVMGTAKSVTCRLCGHPVPRSFLRCRTYLCAPCRYQRYAYRSPSRDREHHRFQVRAWERLKKLEGYAV
jgi:hypothetical protein